MARELGNSSIDEARVIGRLRSLKRAGVIRRFGALVAHRRIGYAFNGMTVWDVVPARLDQAGAAFAVQPFVSHCYARPRSDAWPYNLYAMVHAKTQGELDAHVAALEAAVGLRAQVLVSTREYKKSSMRYFVE
jgi:DNA-binding Lrp family transcriptional regulator